MEFQMTAADIERILVESNQGLDKAQEFLDFIGEDVAKKLIEWTAGWIRQSLMNEDGQVSLVAASDMVAAMAALSIGMFEIGWKAHEQYGGSGEYLVELASAE